LPSITEIEELIIRLHKEGKTMREIAKVVHKNFTYIGAILKTKFPEEFIENSTSNNETKALKLFSEERSPTQVAIELRSSAEEIEKFYTSFWRLEGLYELYRIYKELNVRAFIRFYNQLRDRRMANRRGFHKIIELIDTNVKTDIESANFNIDASPQIWNNDSSNDEDVLV
jgi:hypothetical protein